MKKLTRAGLPLALLLLMFGLLLSACGETSPTAVSLAATATPVNTPVATATPTPAATATPTKVVTTMVAPSPATTKATTAPVTAKPRAAQEDDIREAVFRYQFQHNASGQQQGVSVYCLSLLPAEKLQGQDPSDEFLQRFQGNVPTVKKWSDCIINTQESNMVQDKVTGKPGLIFGVHSIKWVSETEVEAQGGYFEAGLSASGNTYKLALENGQWIVKEAKMQWIA